MTPTAIQWIGTGLFAIAILHTFLTKVFQSLARTRPTHAGIWHLLGEIEVAFGFWASVMALAMFAIEGTSAATQYLDSRDFTEPMFVFAVMVIAGTRPILQTVTVGAKWIASIIPLPGSLGLFLVVTTLVPMLGSLITEPAAMTLAALILADSVFSRGISTRLKYATLGMLFVNISIGGTLTPFAAPPVLMVAGEWGWGMSFMMTTFGWKAAIAVVINAVGVALVFRKQLAGLPMHVARGTLTVPPALIFVHLAFLIGVIIFAHHTPIFMGIFLFFLGVAHAYRGYQDRLILREGLLVAFFLAGLVVLGGQQQWWLQPTLLSLNNSKVLWGSMVLTAFTDNAAITYLGSLVGGLSDGFKYALMVGVVSGGGLTVIANAPNPAGLAILREHFDDSAVSPIAWVLAALPPTLIAAMAFMLL